MNKLQERTLSIALIAGLLTYAAIVVVFIISLAVYLASGELPEHIGQFIKTVKEASR